MPSGTNIMKMSEALNKTIISSGGCDQRGVNILLDRIWIQNLFKQWVKKHTPGACSTVMWLSAHESELQ